MPNNDDAMAAQFVDYAALRITAADNLSFAF
ncbi:hypothetical protein DIKCMJMK_00742 [Shewanella oneidensis]|nr:hypothetical protein [Shewanella oneidensis]